LFGQSGWGTPLAAHSQVIWLGQSLAI
jgi:hypothetical protein